jgi:8-oxo-dGTP pyrophosphatase MutT (NUDIX family)
MRLVFYESCVESIPQQMAVHSYQLEQAAAIPFRIHPVNGLEYLLITNRSATKWVFPKGHVEVGRSPSQQASIEAAEEAGVLGRLLHPAVGTFTYEKNGGQCRVTVFLLHVERELNRWPESAWRRRVWKDFPEALRLHGREEAQSIYSTSLRSVEERFGEIEQGRLTSNDLELRWRAAG